jgi:hypothetical protein
MLEQQITERLKNAFVSRADEIMDTDSDPRPMNIFGEDLELTNIMRQRLPLSIECLKSDKTFEDIYDCYDNAEARAISIDDDKILQPVLFIQQGEEEPLAIMNCDLAIALFQALYVNGEVSDEEENHATKH